MRFRPIQKKSLLIESIHPLYKTITYRALKTTGTLIVIILQYAAVLGISCMSITSKILVANDTLFDFYFSAQVS
jgi:hypothetical protein